MPGVLLDTHTVVWYLARSALLSAAARRAILAAVAAAEPVYVASISLVEIQYLVERGRLPQLAFDSLDQALLDPNVALEAVPLDHRVARAVAQVPRSQVPDMPDRIIAATALT